MATQWMTYIRLTLHTNGLTAYFQALNRQELRANRKVKLVTHPQTFERRALFNGTDIGCPVSPKEVQETFELITTKKPYELAENVIFTGEVPREYENPEAVGYHYQNGELKPDFVYDDGSLVFNLKKGLVIVTGCAHAGILNIAKYAQKLCNRNVYAIVGGFHLMEASQARLDNIIKNFKEMKVQKILPGHCTGLEAICRMRRELNAVKINSGDVLEI